jgi:hypothetical protein
MPAILWSLFLMVASYVIQSILVKPNVVEAATLAEFDFPQFEDGTPNAVLFGDGWTNSWMVLWYGNFSTIKIKAGGKK